jgi:lysophospholipase L1-like esterase
VKKTTGLAVGVFALVLAVPTMALADPASPPSRASVPSYLALGDSLATGVGASDRDETAYVPLFHQYLRENLSCGRGDSQVCPSLRLNNIGVSGATSTTLLANQLPKAITELQARNQDLNTLNDVEVITVDIGGNDVFGLVQTCAGGFTPACQLDVQQRFTTFIQSFSATLTQLRAAAGPDTEIVVMTYYNSLVGCNLSALSSLGDIVLEGNPALLPMGLNDWIRAIAAGAGASVAETYGLLGPDDLVGGTDCLHANDSGYRIIAGAFAEAI